MENRPVESSQIGDLFEDSEGNQWIFRGPGAQEGTFSFRLRGRVLFVDVSKSFASGWKRVDPEPVGFSNFERLEESRFRSRTGTHE